MEKEKIQLVQQTWQQIVPIADVAADLFYTRLFDASPAIKGLFANTDMSAQKGKLLKTLASVVANLHAPTGLMIDVEELGQRHCAYGVKAEHYDLVGQALLWTLEQGLGDAWSSDVREAWSEAYQMIATGMLRGAAISGSDEVCDHARFA